MNRTEMLSLAAGAAEGNRAALARFKEVAQAAGFVGGRGGWIRLNGLAGAIACQGWQALASRAKGSGWVLERLLEAEADREVQEAEMEAEREAQEGTWEGAYPYGIIRLAGKTGAANPEPGWMSQCRAPRCPGHWRTGLGTDVEAREAYLTHVAESPACASLDRYAARTDATGRHGFAVVEDRVAGDNAEVFTGPDASQKAKARAAELNAGRDLVEVEDAEKDLGAGLYALEVLEPVAGVARVAVLRDDQRVQVFHGDTALMDATSAMIKYNAGTDSPPEMVEPKIHPGDVVTIHQGTRRYMVSRVELDSFKNGERCDYARVTPCAPEDDREPQWVAMDLLHLVEPVARLTTSVRNGILVTEDLVELNHHVAGSMEVRRVALVQDPAAGGAGMTALLVDPRFPEGTPVHHNASAEIPALFPGDAVVVERPSGNALYRWLPDMADADAVLVNMTYADRHAWTS